MFRHSLKYAAPVTFAWLMLCLTARALGEGQPPHPALRGFTEGCEGRPQPCWYGIVPGVTTVDEMVDLLELNSHVPNIRANTASIHLVPQNSPGICSLNVEVISRIVTRLNLKYCRDSGVRVGDLASHLAFRADGGDGSLDWAHTIFAAIPWGWTLQTPAADRIVTLTAETAPAREWHGFVPRWRYCQLEPGTRGCPRGS